MKNLKKKALIAGSYVAVASIAVGGTLALLTDESQNVNVMTMGNVAIEQHEYQRVVENGDFKTATIDEQTSYVLEEFEQNKVIVPAAEPTNHGAGPWDGTPVRMSQVDSHGGMSVFTSENAVDKFVTVENTGRTGAFVRTIVAIEVGETDGSLIGTSYHGCWQKNEIENLATIDGVKYKLFEYTYDPGENGATTHADGVLPAGETSYPSLSQVYIASKATSEDIEAIDGNNDGKLNILVVSQAVQARGDSPKDMLDEAFGKITYENHPWADGNVSVATVFTSGEHTIYGTATTAVGSADDPIEASGANTVVNILGGKYTSGDPDCAVWAHDGATVNIYGGEFTCGECADVATSHSDLIYAGSKSAGTTGFINIYGGTFSAPAEGDWLLNEADNLGEIKVYGGTFVNWNPADNVSEGAHTNFLAEGYKVVVTEEGTDTIYTVVAE